MEKKQYAGCIGFTVFLRRPMGPAGKAGAPGIEKRDRAANAARSLAGTGNDYIWVVRTFFRRAKRGRECSLGASVSP